MEIIVIWEFNNKPVILLGYFILRIWGVIRKMSKIIYEKAEFEMPQQWKLNHNKLFKFDLQKEEGMDNRIWNELSEDILNIVNYESNIILDVGWYPKGSKNGQYGLVVIENNDWLKPIETFVTRNTNELIEKITMILNKY